MAAYQWPADASQSASYQMVYPDGFDAMQQGTLSTINNFERHYYGLD
ncbi:MAG: hypothetical protein ACR5LG_14590 [Sodalis sp. (in: enterobacteria)]